MLCQNVNKLEVLITYIVFFIHFVLSKFNDLSTAAAGFGRIIEIRTFTIDRNHYLLL